MATCGFCWRSDVSVDSQLMCDSCRTARAIAREIKNANSSSSSSDVSEFQTTNRYGALGYYLLFNCVIVAFDITDKNVWSLFGFLENRFLDGLLTYLVGLGFLYLLWRWMEYQSKGWKFATLVFIALNLFLVYLVVDLFVDALPLLS
jgi:hypothetical protein